MAIKLDETFRVKGEPQLPSISFGNENLTEYIFINTSPDFKNRDNYKTETTFNDTAQKWEKHLSTKIIIGVPVTPAEKVKFLIGQKTLEELFTKHKGEWVEINTEKIATEYEGTPVDADQELPKTVSILDYETMRMMKLNDQNVLQTLFYPELISHNDNVHITRGARLRNIPWFETVEIYNESENKWDMYEKTTGKKSEVMCLLEDANLIEYIKTFSEEELNKIHDDFIRGNARIKSLPNDTRSLPTYQHHLQQFKKLQEQIPESMIYNTVPPEIADACKQIPRDVMLDMISSHNAHKLAGRLLAEPSRILFELNNEIFYGEVGQITQKEGSIPQIYFKGDVVKVYPIIESAPIHAIPINTPIMVVHDNRLQVPELTQNKPLEKNYIQEQNNRHVELISCAILVREWEKIARDENSKEKDFNTLLTDFNQGVTLYEKEYISRIGVMFQDVLDLSKINKPQKPKPAEAVKIVDEFKDKKAMSYTMREFATEAPHTFIATTSHRALVLYDPQSITSTKKKFFIKDDNGIFEKYNFPSLPAITPLHHITSNPIDIASLKSAAAASEKLGKKFDSSQAMILSPTGAISTPIYIDPTTIIPTLSALQSNGYTKVRLYFDKEKPDTSVVVIRPDRTELKDKQDISCACIMPSIQEDTWIQPTTRIVYPINVELGFDPIMIKRVSKSECERKLEIIENLTGERYSSNGVAFVTKLPSSFTGEFTTDVVGLFKKAIPEYADTVDKLILKIEDSLEKSQKRIKDFEDCLDKITVFESRINCDLASKEISKIYPDVYKDEVPDDYKKSGIKNEFIKKIYEGTIFSNTNSENTIAEKFKQLLTPEVINSVYRIMYEQNPQDDNPLLLQEPINKLLIEFRGVITKEYEKELLTQLSIMDKRNQLYGSMIHLNEASVTELAIIAASTQSECKSTNPELDCAFKEKEFDLLAIQFYENLNKNSMGHYIGVHDAIISGDKTYEQIAEPLKIQSEIEPPKNELIIEQDMVQAKSVHQSSFDFDDGPDF